MTIHYKNGMIETLSKSMYDKYTYDGKAFIIMKNNDMLALINIDSISGIYFD